MVNEVMKSEVYFYKIGINLMGLMVKQGIRTVVVFVR